MKRVLTISLAIVCICLFFGYAYHQMEMALDTSPYEVTGNDKNSDTYAHYLPRLTYIKQSVLEGSFPLWNPYEAVGHPFLAEIGTRLFYPSTWIVLLLDAPKTIMVMQFLDVLIGLVGMILYLRYLNLKWPSIVLASVIFGYSVFSESFHAPPLGSSYCWLPLVLLAAHRLFDKPGFGSCVVLAVPLGFSFLGGFPHYFYYICLFVSGYFLILIFFALSRYDLKSITVRLLLFAGAFILMTGLVGVQFFPTLELAQQSVHRMGEQLTNEQIGVFRNLFFSPADMPRTFLRNYSVIVFLIPLAFASKRNRRVAIALSALLAYAVLFVLSYQVPYLAIFGKIPFVGLFRIPERIMVFQDFVVCVVGAIGLSQLQGEDAPKLWGADKKTQVLSWIYVSFCLLLMPFPLLGRSIKIAFHSPMYVLIHMPWITALLILLLCLSKATSRVKVVGTLCILLLFSLGFAYCGHVFSPIRPEVTYLSTFLIAFIIIVFISAFASRLPQWAKMLSIATIVTVVLLNFDLHRKADIKQPAPALTEVEGHDSLFDERIEWIEDNVGYDRVLLSRKGSYLVLPDADLGYMYRFYHINSYEPFTQTRWKLFVRSIVGAEEFDTEVERLMFYGIIKNGIRDSFICEPRMVGLASLKYVVDLGYLEQVKIPEGWTLIHRGTSGYSEFSVYKNRFSLPRAYLVNSYRVIQDREAALEALRQEISLRPDSVVIENGNPSFPSSMSIANPGKVRIGKYEINRVELEVEAGGPCLVVLTDCFYPGWKVFVDGEEQPILRANYLFRAVEVTTGNHTVVFRYRPASVLWGATISLASLFVVFTGLLIRRRYQKARQQS